jgi:short-subunit dehydrogenase
MSSNRRVAIVTGASSGIGEASARALGSAGFDVAIVARREDRLRELAQQIEERGSRALSIPADLGDEAATSKVLLRVLEEFGGVDVLVNNAGYSPGAAIEQVTRDELRNIFDVNLFSALQLIGEVVPHMREQGGGRIINIGSLAGSVPAPLAIPYAATKSGLDAATRGLRLELLQSGIKLSLVIPGFVDTAVFENAREGSQHLRDDPDNPYRQIFFDMDALATRSLEKALSPADVAEVVVRAATARNPKKRYYAPFSARLQSDLLGLLPERWLDQILARVYKLA